MFKRDDTGPPRDEPPPEDGVLDSDSNSGSGNDGERRSRSVPTCPTKCQQCDFPWACRMAGGCCSAYNKCGTSNAHCAYGSTDCSGCIKRTTTATTNVWCNGAKTLATPATGSGTADTCIAQCAASTSCGWVGHRPSDNYCEFWTAGSCSRTHYQGGHNIYSLAKDARKVAAEADTSAYDAAVWAVPTTGTTNVWCNNAKAHATPATGSGTKDACIAQCAASTSCGWVGHNPSANYCEFWTAGSCWKTHYQSGHNIYKVDDTAQDAAATSNDAMLTYEMGVKKAGGSCITPDLGMSTTIQVMGDNPHLTINAEVCAAPVYAKFTLDMGGYEEIFGGEYILRGKGQILGMTGIHPKTLAAYFKFQGKAEISLEGIINVKLGVSALYQFTKGWNKQEHRIQLAGSVEISGCRRRKRRSAAELQVVLRRDPRFVHKKFAAGLGNASV